jgi:AraC-like DNA-binding protein
LLVLPDAACEAELFWRDSERGRRAALIKGPSAIYTPPKARSALDWKRMAALARLFFTPEFIRQSAASIPQANVFIRHEWDLAGLMVHQLFCEFGELCRHHKDPSGQARYLEGLGAFAACCIVSQIGRKPINGMLPLPKFRLVLEHIELHPRGRILTGTLARIAGFGEHHFTRLFKARTGMTTSPFITMKRLERVRQLLSGGMGIAEAAMEAGFYDQSHYAQMLRKFCKKSAPNDGNADFIQ